MNHFSIDMETRKMDVPKIVKVLIELVLLLFEGKKVVYMLM